MGYYTHYNAIAIATENPLEAFPEAVPVKAPANVVVVRVPELGL